MKKKLKYKIRRLLFIYIPCELIIMSVLFIAMIKAGIYVL